MAKYYLYTILFLSIIFINIGCDEEFVKDPPYPPATEEEMKMNQWFADILCDQDRLSAVEGSLDTFILDSLHCHFGNGINETCDSAYYNKYDVNKWIKTGDTLLLKDKNIFFTSNGLDLELASFTVSNYPYIEIYPNGACCDLLHVYRLDTLAKEIDFSIDNFSSKIVLFVKSND